ncbi:MAG: HNH endonuclease [Anaerolineae bacterium]|nr:HNH endonuclease [Anaerolineae bacterium]
MSTQPPEQKIRQLLASMPSKRARIVIEHILEHEFITTEELKNYGYEHPPRAARDVREAGIPLRTFRVPSSEGRLIAAYEFGDLTGIRTGRSQGRRAFSKKFKEKLYELSGGRCAICSGQFESRYLQIDHRVPYEVASDVSESERNEQDYMLLCGSCNRAKSWSCEHCANWLNDKLPQVCLTCYWANPENHLHVALREVRRTDILWHEGEIEAYERLKQLAQESKFPIPEYVKRIVAKYLSDI